MRRFALRLTTAVAVTFPISVIALPAVSDMGQQPRQSGTPMSIQSHMSGERKNPYGKLFQPRPSDLRQLKSTQPPDLRPQPALPAGSHEPQIECKIRAILVDPSIDRGIRLPTPSPDTTLALRLLEHPCLKP